MNCLNPKFSKTFVIDYYFEMVQKLRFEIYDIDSDACSVQDADFLGELECTLGQVGCLSGSRRWTIMNKMINLNHSLRVKPRCKTTLFVFRSSPQGSSQNHWS